MSPTSAREHLRSNTTASCKILPSPTSMLNTRNVKQRIAKETKEVQGKALESTTKSGRQMEESGIHTEPSLSMSHIALKVKTFLKIFSSLH